MPRQESSLNLPLRRRRIEVADARDALADSGLGPKNWYEIGTKIAG
jgi:hypothetical protein